MVVGIAAKTRPSESTLTIASRNALKADASIRGTPAPFPEEPYVDAHSLLLMAGSFIRQAFRERQQKTVSDETVQRVMDAIRHAHVMVLGTSMENSTRDYIEFAKQQGALAADREIRKIVRDEG